LRASLERWRSLVENVPGIINNIAPDGTVLFVNRVKVLESVEKVTGSNIYDLVPDADRGWVRAKIEGVFQTGHPDEYEVRFPYPNGDGAVLYSTQVAPVWRDGKVESVLLINTDITERRMAEDALRASESRFRAMNDASPF